MKRVLEIGNNDVRLFFRSKASYVWLFIAPTILVYFLGFASRGPGGPFAREVALSVNPRATNILGRVTLAAFAGDELKARLPLNEALVELTDEQRRHGPSGSASAQFRAYVEGSKPALAGFNFSVPGNLVMYLMLNLLVFGGTTTAAGRRNGTLRRLVATPASRMEIVLGKIYGNTALGMAQIVYFLIIGKLLFGINLGANLPGVVLILLALAWAAAAMGVLAGCAFAAEDRVLPVCALAGLLMGALGGCWWPLEMAPPVFKEVALCVPDGWALKGLNQLISFGGGFSAAVVPAEVLLGLGAGANALAVWFFRV